MATIILLVYVPNCIIQKQATFKIDPATKIVIFGHSHPECAYNDQLIPKFKNLCQSGESYFYTYQKVKKVLSQNKQVKIVLIEFSNNQIDVKMNDWTWGLDYMSTKYPTYSAFMDKADFAILIKNNRKDLMSCVSLSTQKNLLRILTSNYNFIPKIGGYLKIEHNETLDERKNIVAKTYNVSKKSVLSATNINYLQKIVAYCQSKGTKIFLVRTPQHKNYEFLSNERDFYNIREKYFSSVEFLDFNNFPLKDEEFADYGHLNYNGATKFSKWFNNMLQSDLLIKKHKQAIINKGISNLKTLENITKKLITKQDLVGTSVLRILKK